MQDIMRALRHLEAALHLADKPREETLVRLIEAPMDAFTSQDLRRMKIPMEEIKDLAKRRLVNIKRDVDGDFYFEVSTLGRQVGSRNG